jgi:hypothetical protein
MEAFALIMDAMRECLEACISLFAADVFLFLVLSPSQIPDASDKSKNLYSYLGYMYFLQILFLSFVISFNVN